jgi:N-glycosidase YbiA
MASLDPYEDDKQYYKDKNSLGTINFYGEKHWLSNSYPCVVKDKVGNCYPTVEHFFQSMKFSSPLMKLRIITAATPTKAKQLGRTNHESFRSDWEEVKESVMLTGLKAKFFNNKELRDLLTSTDGYYLSEHTIRDTYWADGGNDKGKNRLGILLMRVRDLILQQQKR